MLMCPWIQQSNIQSVSISAKSTNDSNHDSNNTDTVLNPEESKSSTPSTTASSKEDSDDKHELYRQMFKKYGEIEMNELHYISSNTELRKSCINKWRYERDILRGDFVASQMRVEPTADNIVIEGEKDGYKLTAKKHLKRMIAVYQRKKGARRGNAKNEFLNPKSDKSVIQEKVRSGRWAKLYVKSDLPNRGRGVFTAVEFSKGEIVCDYRGPYLTSAQGNEEYSKQRDTEGMGAYSTIQKSTQTSRRHQSIYLMMESLFSYS